MANRHSSDEFSFQAGRKKNITEATRERDRLRYINNREALLAKNKEWHKNNKEKWSERHRKDSLRKLYGITPEQYDELLYEQGGVCAVCGKEDIGRKGAKYFSVDHDHETGVIRGLLCRHCNIGLGTFMDDVELLESAIRYLKEHQTRQTNVDREGSD